MVLSGAGAGRSAPTGAALLPSYICDPDEKIDAPDADKMAMIGHTSMEMTTHYTHTDLKSDVNIATQL